MSEIKFNHSSAIRECTKNYRLRSWISAVFGMYLILAGYAVFAETRPYMSIAAIIFGVLSIRNSNEAKINAARYPGWAVIILGIMEWITCFM